MAQVVARYVELLTTLEKKTRPLAEPEWKSLDLAFFGPGGLATVPTDEPRFVLARPDRQRYIELNKAVKQLEAKTSGKAGRAMVMRDAPKPVDPHVFIRGNPGRPGKAVPRRFLKVLSGPGSQALPEGERPAGAGPGHRRSGQSTDRPGAGQPGLALALRPGTGHHPQRLRPAQRPSLPPRAARRPGPLLHENGWSIKALHRRIMLSSTYQQQSNLRPDCLDRDPQNRLLWRFNRQRLDFEAMRDSILAVAGTLDLSEGGPSVVLTEPPFSPRRTVYGFIDRQNLDGVYRTFDFAVPDATSPKRFVTTVPQQALFLMNSPFVQAQARALAASARA